MAQHEYETRADVRMAFLNQHAQLKDAAFDEWTELNFDETERIMGALALNLWRYRRSVDERFTRWAMAWVRRETRRYRFLAELRTRYEQLIYAAVERGLYRSPAEDAAIEPCDHLSDLIIHLMEHPRKIDGLIAPQRAKSSTVLYGLMSSRTRAFRSKINKRRVRVVQRLADDSLGECERVEISEIVAAA